MIRATDRTVTICAVAALAIFLGAAGSIYAESVNICPHKIILNAEGNYDDVQAIIHMVLPSSNIVDFDVVLRFNGVDVATAESAFYCAIDDNLIVGFDRKELQDNPDVIALAGQPVTATVEGSVTVFDGVTLTTREFSGTDPVQILKPGQK